MSFPFSGRSSDPTFKNFSRDEQKVNASQKQKFVSLIPELLRAKSVDSVVDSVLLICVTLVTLFKLLITNAKAKSK